MSQLTINALAQTIRTAQQNIGRTRDEILGLLREAADAGRLRVKHENAREDGWQVESVGQGWVNGNGDVGVYVTFRTARGKPGVRQQGYLIQYLEVRDV